MSAMDEGLARDAEGGARDLPDDPGESLPGGAQTAPPTERARTALTLSVWRVDPGREAQEPEPKADPLPVFQLGRFVARGGCGEVWEARQASLDRVVAVKKISDSLRTQAGTDGYRRRRVETDFRMEAITTARLDHPNIVPVYDLGTDPAGWPVMAMKLVRGASWQDVLQRDFAEMAPSDYLAKHLPIFLSMIQAVAFAHSRGVIHRDLKPSQVMVGEFGEVLLMDWGLAIAAGDADSGGGEPIHDLADHLPTPASASSPSGTPYFMAPEQTGASAGAITFRTDVYLLGGTLYYILSNAFPHQASSSSGAMAMAAAGKVVPFERVAPDREIPEELAALAMEAMAADPAARVPSATAFIQRVQQWMSGASRRTESERLAREAAERHAASPSADRRSASEEKYAACAECLNLLQRATTLWPANPAIPDLRATILADYADHAIRSGDLTLAHGILASMEKGPRREELSRRADERLRAQRRAARQRRLAVALVVVLGLLHVVGSYLYIRDQRRAAERIASERDAATEARRQAEASQREAVRQQGIAEAARVDAEVEQYFANVAVAGASLDEGRAEKARDILMTKTPPAFHQWEWGHLLARLSPDDMAIPGLAITPSVFSPDGTRIYSGDREGNVTVHDAATGEKLAEHRVHKGRICTLRVDAEGNRLLASSFDRNASIVDARTGAVLVKFEGHADVLRCAAFSPDGCLVATSAQDRTARVWDAATGRQMLSLADFKSSVQDVCFSPDGRALLTAARDSSVRLWDVESGALLREYSGAQEAVLTVRYSPDGARILSACRDFKARVHDAATGELLLTLENPGAPLNSASWSPDGAIVATAGEDGFARLWNARTGERVAEIASDPPMLGIQFSPDGKRAMTMSSHWVRLWDLARVVESPRKTVVSPASPDWKAPADTVQIFGLTKGRDPSWNEREKVWNVPEGRTLVEYRGRTFAVDSRFATFSPDASLRVDVDPATNFGVVRDAKTNEVVHELPRVPTYKALFSPDGRTLAFIEPVDRTTLFDTATWEPRAVLRMDPEKAIKVAIELYIAASAAWTPDGRFLAIPYLNDRIVLWNAETFQPRYETPKTVGMGPGIAFDADGSRFAVAGNDDRCTVWKTATGEMLFDLVGHTRPVLGVSFSPDGQRLASFSRDATIKLWDAATGREVLTLLKLPGSLAQDGDGDTIVADTFVAAQFTADGRAIFYATARGDFGLLESFPWRVADYPGPADMALADRIERWKRAARAASGALFAP